MTKLTKRNLSKCKREDERARHSPLTTLITKITEISGDQKYQERSGERSTSSNGLLQLTDLSLSPPPVECSAPNQSRDRLRPALRSRSSLSASNRRMLATLRPVQPPVSGEESSSKMPARAGAILNNGEGGGTKFAIVVKYGDG